MLNDDEFIEQFESLELDSSYFNHYGHIRLAWLYLNRMDRSMAEQKLVAGINRYATSLGAADKFHFTLTVALARIIHLRLDKSDAKSSGLSSAIRWQNFQQDNQDLFDDALAVVYRHYSNEQLALAEAKIAFIEPRISFDEQCV